VDVLGLLSASAKTGCLELTGDRGHGELWLRDGKIVAGGVRDHPTTAAAEVVFELLLFEEASFEFLVGESGQSEPFESSVADAVEQAEQMLEVWQQVRSAVPDLSMRVTLATEIEGDEVTLSAADWSLAACCVAHPTVGAILDELGLGEFDGCCRLADLVERGLIEVSEVEQPSVSAVDDAELSLVPDEVVPPASDAFGMDLDTDFIDDDQSTDAGGFRAGPPRFVADPPEASGQGAHAIHESPAPGGFPEHFPIDDLVGSGDQVSFDTPPGVSHGHSEVSAFSAEAQPGDSTPSGDIGNHTPFGDPQSVADSDEPAPTDDVLAQIGRLSPKAAEAIAAALGDGDDG
jgi:hypothetical protein